MERKAVSVVLTGALALGAFLCLGMGMDMGASWAPQEDHSCCPGGAPEQPQDSNCCLLLPAAASSPVALPVPLLTAFILTSFESRCASVAAPDSLAVHGPPGSASPGRSAPSAPRAPPVA